MNAIKSLRGFSLIELLIVIAIIASLIAIVTAAINPVEKITIAQDVLKKKDVVSIGKALSRYQLSASVTMFPAPNEIESKLVDYGELKSYPINPSTKAYSCSSLSGQGAVLTNGYCYNATAGNDNSGIVYVPLDAKTNTSVCPDGYVAWYTWLTKAEKANIICQMDEPDPALSDFPDIPVPTSSSSPMISPTPTDTPISTPLPTPTSTPLPTPSPTPSPIPTPTPITCVGIGGTCKTSCKGAQVNQGQLDCSTGYTCCK